MPDARASPNATDHGITIIDRSGRPLERLWLAVSGHGHGHLVQVSPLVRALRARHPGLRVAVQSSLPADLLTRQLGDVAQVHGEAADVGMAMSGPMTVLPAESLAAYRRFHAAWPELLAAQVTRLREFGPDLVIGDVPYLPLAAAKACGVRSVAVCSLNWADVLEHYCTGLDGADGIVRSIRGHYAAADLFLRPSPAMPMETLGNTRRIGPLVTVGRSRRAELRRALGLAEGTRLVLLTLGGIAGGIDVSRWPPFEDTCFLLPDAWRSRAPWPGGPGRFRSIESAGMPFADLFASCDALIAKPGYGAFAGAGCSALPVLFVERGDWPEEPCLRAWLERVGRATSMGRAELVEGRFARALDGLLARPPTPCVEASGAAEALALIETLLDPARAPARRDAPVEGRGIVGRPSGDGGGSARARGRGRASPPLAPRPDPPDP